MVDITKEVRKLKRVAARSWGLRGLSRKRNSITEAVAASIQQTRKHALAPEEKRWFDRIEHLRADMNASTRPITRTDYGAGDPDSNRTAEEMRAGVEVKDTLCAVSRRASKPILWCRLLFKLVRNTRPSSGIEMGTAVGISAAYQAAALKLNGQGALVTLEGTAALADIAKSNFQQLDLDTVAVVVGNFQDTLPDVLSRRQPVDYVFIDGHHDEQATIAYFEQILPFIADKALLVFDDIAWSDGMKQAWKTIATDQRAGIAVDLGAVGLCIIDSSTAKRRYLSIPLR